MINDEKQAFERVKMLSSDSMCDNDIYIEFLKSKLKQSEDDIRNGRVITLGELRKHIDKLEEKYESNNL